MQDPLREMYELLCEGKLTGHPMTAEESAVWEAARGVLLLLKNNLEKRCRKW